MTIVQTFKHLQHCYFFGSIIYNEYKDVVCFPSFLFSALAPSHFHPFACFFCRRIPVKSVLSSSARVFSSASLRMMAETKQTPMEKFSVWKFSSSFSRNLPAVRGLRPGLTIAG